MRRLLHAAQALPITPAVEDYSSLQGLALRELPADPAGSSKDTCH